MPHPGMRRSEEYAARLFLDFFRNMGLNFTGLEESLFTQLGRVSLVGNADGSYTLTVGEWETVFEIGLSTEEEMYAE